VLLVLDGSEEMEVGEEMKDVANTEVVMSTVGPRVDVGFVKRSPESATPEGQIVAPQVNILLGPGWPASAPASASIELLKVPVSPSNENRSPKLVTVTLPFPARVEVIPKKL